MSTARGSPNLQAAADYAVEQFTEWGLANIAQDVWGEFGRGWTNDRFYAHAIEPQAYPLIGYPKAWTPGTGGVVSGEAVLAIIENDADIEKHRGTLASRFVLTAPVPEVRATTVASSPILSESGSPLSTDLASGTMSSMCSSIWPPWRARE